VLLGELIAEYETPADATAEAVRLNHLRIPLFPPATRPTPSRRWRRTRWRGEAAGVKIRIGL